MLSGKRRDSSLRVYIKKILRPIFEYAWMECLIFGQEHTACKSQDDLHILTICFALMSYKKFFMKKYEIIYKKYCKHKEIKKDFKKWKDYMRILKKCH